MSLDVERAAIGWRIAQAGDEQDAANFAYDHMDEILAELATLQATLERERKAKIWVTDAWVPLTRETELLVEIERLKAALRTGPVP